MLKRSLLRNLVTEITAFWEVGGVVGSHFYDSTSFKVAQSVLGVAVNGHSW